MTHWGTVMDRRIRGARLQTHHLPSAYLLLSLPVVLSQWVALFIVLIFLHFPSVLFYVFIILKSALQQCFCLRLFLHIPLYDVISSRAGQPCGERACHAPPHSSCSVGRMRRLELREYVWPLSPAQNTHTHLGLLHHTAWTPSKGQINYVKIMRGISNIPMHNSCVWS